MVADPPHPRAHLVPVAAAVMVDLLAMVDLPQKAPAAVVLTPNDHNLSHGAAGLFKKLTTEAILRPLLQQISKFNFLTLMHYAHIIEFLLIITLMKYLMNLKNYQVINMKYIKQITIKIIYLKIIKRHIV